VLAAAGVVVAGAGGTAIYFATRNTSSDSALHITGSIH
jgi:hypothetical protein